MADIYSNEHLIFWRESSPRDSSICGKYIFLTVVVTLPLFVFSMVYVNIVKNRDLPQYTRSYRFHPPGLWTHRANSYNNHSNSTDMSERIDGVFDSDPREPLQFKIVCYYNFPGVDSDLQPSAIDPFLCTHINVGFAQVAPDGTLSLNPAQLTIVTRLVDLKLTNPDLKVLVSVGGAGNEEGFPEMVLDHPSRKRFIHSVVKLVKRFKIDGVDLDWEFPNQSGDFDKRQKLHFTQLLEEFRMTIDRQARHKFLLTMAVAAPAFLVDQSYNVPYVDKFVDFINVMTYDYHFFTKTTPFTGLNSPLYQSDEDQGVFSSMNTNYSLSYWLQQGMSRSKIVVGLPTYGHTFRLQNEYNNGLYAPAKGYGKLGNSGFVDFASVCEFMTTNHIVPIFDPKSQSPYAFKHSEWFSFDDIQSITIKTEYIRNQRFGGAMVYSLNADDYRGTCRLVENVPNEVFPLTRRVGEVLAQNYSLF